MTPEQSSRQHRNAPLSLVPQDTGLRLGYKPVPISVSIVTYNTPESEIAGVLTDLGRSRRPVAVTVVDNSPEHTLRAPVEQAGYVYLPTGSNLGFGGGHNLAFRHALAVSKYHLVCNPDVRFGPEVLGALARFMDVFPEVGMVMPRVLYPDGREQQLCKRLPTPADLLLRRFLGGLGRRWLRRSTDAYELRHIDLSTAREVPSLSGCFMFLRSSVLQEIGLFDPRFFMYMEDVDLCRRIGSVARTVFNPAVTVTHSYAKGSYKNRKLFHYHIISALRYFAKWGWFWDPGRRMLNQRTAALDAGRDEEATATYAGTRQASPGS